MEYFRFEDDDPNGITYIESEDGYAVRQITVTNNKYIASNRRNKEYGYWLAEGLIDGKEAADFGVDKIDKSQFEGVWDAYRAELLQDWQKTKDTFPIGQVVEGYIQVFYPQGVIIQISGSVVGLADYEECKHNIKSEKLYPNHKIKAEVIGYDEINLWLMLNNPVSYYQSS
ncbi:hypothetical protein [Shimazuella kribbensis]|uniref:hypothetical protein n=1 Tax=Shimazuella kribbensis TaxID=139808 RepID=UPI00040A2126|nr:hypothetical protein [Shimazuella kribbensis]